MLLPMVLWKVWPIDFVIQFNVLTHDVVAWPSTWLEALDFSAPILAPIGLSFGAFRAADLLVRTNLGLVDRLSAGRVLASGLFPPLLVVGPIASFDETEHTIDHPVSLERERFVSGASQILTGLFKVFVIAYLLDWSIEVFAFYGDNAPWRLWVGLVAFTWFFYVNFAGYSDMAIGAGTLLGADLRPNFDRPYLQTTPAAFWNSWHISLTRFLRINVYTPIVAGHPRRQYFGTTITMLLIALWHGVTWATWCSVSTTRRSWSATGCCRNGARRPRRPYPPRDQVGRDLRMVRAEPAVAPPAARPTPSTSTARCWGSPYDPCAPLPHRPVRRVRLLAERGPRGDLGRGLDARVVVCAGPDTADVHRSGPHTR